MQAIFGDLHTFTALFYPCCLYDAIANYSLSLFSLFLIRGQADGGSLL